MKHYRVGETVWAKIKIPKEYEYIWVKGIVQKAFEHYPHKKDWLYYISISVGSNSFATISVVKWYSDLKKVYTSECSYKKLLDNLRTSSG